MVSSCSVRSPGDRRADVSANTGAVRASYPPAATRNRAVVGHAPAVRQATPTAAYEGGTGAPAARETRPHPVDPSLIKSAIFYRDSDQNVATAARATPFPKPAVDQRRRPRNRPPPTATAPATAHSHSPRPGESLQVEDLLQRRH